jgi:predicted dehydrogenase
MTVVTRTGDGYGEDAYQSRQPFFREYDRLLLYETGISVPGACARDVSTPSPQALTGSASAGIHFIDVFRFLFGEPSHVYARLRRLNPAIRGEDAGLLLLEYDSGLRAAWDANRVNESEDADPRFTFGTFRCDCARGHVTMDATGRMLLKLHGQDAVEVDYPHPRQNFGSDCVFHLQRHFLDGLLHNHPLENEVDAYLQNLRVMEAAYLSHQLHRPVPLTEQPQVPRSS